MEIGKTYINVVINEFKVRRTDDSFTVFFEFNSADEVIGVKLIGVRETDNLCEILNADRLWIEKNENTQAEYGLFTLGISHEYFTEIVFDEVKKPDS